MLCVIFTGFHPAVALCDVQCGVVHLVSSLRTLQGERLSDLQDMNNLWGATWEVPSSPQPPASVIDIF